MYNQKEVHFERENGCFINYIGYEVLTAVVMNNPILWDITPCSPSKPDSGGN
jgi:hypothetical protein